MRLINADKLLRDMMWLYDTLLQGGKTAEFYEAQAPIIGEAIKRMISAQQSEKKKEGDIDAK